MSSNSHKPADGDFSSRADISITSILAASGLAMLVFVPGSGRIFGLGVLLLALATAARDILFRRPRVVAIAGSVLEALRRLRARTNSLPVDLTRWATGASAILLGAAGIYLWGRQPPEYAYFLTAMAVVAGICCLAWPRIVRRTDLPLPVAATAAGVALILLAVAAMSWTVYTYSANIPFFDEYISTLPLVTNYPEMTSDELMAALATTHYSHMIMTTRLAALGVYLLQGQLNFQYLVWISYAFFLGIAILVYISLPTRLRNPVYFAPFALVLFQPQFHQLSLWGFSVQHFACYFFAMAAFMLLERREPVSWLAIIAFIAAAYSFALGVFVGVIALAYLVDGRRNREAVFWLVPIALVLVREFSMPASFDDDALRAMGLTKASISGKLQYMLQFMGSFATLGYFSDFMNGQIVGPSLAGYREAEWIAWIAACTLLAGFAYLTAHRYWRRNVTLYGTMLLIVLSAIATAEQRSLSIQLANWAFLSRYTINSVLMAGLLYCAITELHPRLIRCTWPFVAATAAVFCALSYEITLPYARNHAADLRFTALRASNAVYQDVPHLSSTSPLFQFGILRTAADKGVYSFPERTITRGLQREGKSVDTSAVPEQPVDWRLVYAGENATTYTFMVAPRENVTEPEGSPHILLTSRAAALAFPLLQLSALPGHRHYLKGESPEGVDHIVCVAKSDLPDEPMHVSIYVTNRPNPARENTGLVLPTIETPASTLSATNAEDVVLHEVGRRSYSVERPSGWSIVTVDPESKTVPFNRGLTIETVVGLGELSSARNAKLWVLSREPNAQGVAFQLSLLGEAFVLLGNDGARWTEIGRVAAARNTWNWIGVSIEGSRVSLFAAAHDPATDMLGPVQFNNKQGADLFAGNPGIIEVATGRDAASNQIADIYELRILSQGSTTESITQRWPVFRAPAAGRGSP